MKKYRIDLPIVVEGKYDKNTLMQIFDATVVYIGGFGIFNSKEKQALLRRLAVNGIIILVDPDGGGKQIRSFLNGIIQKDKIYNAYIPRVEGKERRKDKPSKAGLLGVEGMDRESLVRALSPFIVDEPAEASEDGEGLPRVKLKDDNRYKMLTKVDFFNDGLTGCPNASARRAALAAYFGLPTDMTANALLEALSIITDRDGYERALASINAAEDK